MINNPWQNQFNYQNAIQAQAQQQYQQSGLISVRSEMEARNYAIAPGNSLMFKDESQPYVYVKTMGPSQFDQPTFEKFRLVKEEADVPQQVEQPEYVLKSEFEKLRDEIQTFMKTMKEEPKE